MTHTSVPEDERAKLGITDTLVSRYYIYSLCLLVTHPLT